MVKRNIKKLLMSLCLCAAFSPGAMAQLNGYYRIQNGYGTRQVEGKSANDHYVVLSDASYASPSDSYDAAQKDPGSVFYIETSDASDKYGAGALRVDYLRSQGVELIGGHQTKDFKEFWTTTYQPYMWGGLSDEGKYKALRLAGSEGYLYTSRALIESFIYDVANTLLKTVDGNTDAEKEQNKENIQKIATLFNQECADMLDIDCYLIPVSGQQDTYLWKWHTVDMSKVAQFFDDPTPNTGHMALFQSGLNSMRNKLSQTTGQTIEPYEVPILKMLGYDIIADLPNLRTGNYPDNYKAPGADGKPTENFYGLNDKGCGVVSYECIFTHPKLLFGWCKLNLWKMFYHDTPYPKMFGQVGDNGPSYLYNFFRRLGSNKLFMDYFIRYPYDQDIYLIDGYVSGLNTGDQNDEFTPGDENYTANGRFGFRIANPSVNGWSYDDYSTYQQFYETSDDHEANYNKAEGINNDPSAYTKADTYKQTITNAGFNLARRAGGANWIFTPIDINNPVLFQAKLKGMKDGKYYTTAYFDFPIDAEQIQTNVPGTKFWVLGTSTYTYTNPVSKQEYNLIPVSELKGIVPADQPVVVEASTNDSIAIVPADEKPGETPAVESLLKGVTFNVGKTNALSQDTTKYADLSRLHELRLQDAFDYNTYADGTAERLSKELTNRWGIPYDNQIDDIYTLQYNSSDIHNPMGLYLYTGKTLAKNKCFLVINQNVANGKKIIFGDGSTTGINGITTTTENEPLKIYDLQGRRVQEPSVPGIYIVNGKKMLISK